MPEASLIDRLEPGDHVCWTFQDDEDRDAVLAAYVRAAIPPRHKVIYFSYAVTPDQVHDQLAAAGIDVAVLLATDQLELHDAREAYLGTGRFDPTAMIAGCLSACTRAQADGYAGLRLAGDMAWAAEPVIGADHLGQYEAQVNSVYADGYAMGLCLYDGRLFPRSRMTPVRAVHPAAVDVTTPGTWSPMLRIRRVREANGLRLDGETDLSNRGSLTAMLESLPTAGTGGPPVLDLTALRFADVGAARAILVAGDRPGGLRVVGATPHMLRLLDLVGADHASGLIVDRSAAMAVPA